MKWPLVTIESIKANKRHALNGGPFGSKLVSNDYVETGVPVIRGVNLPMDSRFSSKEFVFVSEEKADGLLSNNAHPGDIVFTQRGTLGQVGIIPTACGHDRYVISQSQMKLTVDETQCDPRFVYYYFRNDDTVTTIKGLAISAGVPHINLTILREFRIPKPPLATQRKIAGVLSAYDDLIENNTRRIAILEEMAQAIYREWFVHFRFPGHESARFTDSPLGKIPEGWKRAALGDLARETRRAVDPSEIDPETPYIGLEHLPRRSITLGEWGKAKDVQSTKLAFKAGEILFGKIRPYFHKVGVAPVDGVCSSDAIVIAPKSTSTFGPVLCCVSSDEFVSHATQTSQGTKMPRANWDVLVKYPLPLPPDGLLKRFNSIVEDMVTTLRLLMLKNRNLRTTRDLLLPKLISGQLDVEDLDIDAGELPTETLA